MSREEPARAGDTDPKLSVSGCQQFLGEDLSFAHRARIQQQEQRLWNEEQIAAKQAAKNAVGDLDSTYAQRAMEIDAIKAQLESTAATGRKAQAVAVAEYQLAQAQRHPPTPHAHPSRLWLPPTSPKAPLESLVYTLPNVSVISFLEI